MIRIVLLLTAILSGCVAVPVISSSTVGDYEVAICVKDAGDEPIAIRLYTQSSTTGKIDKTDMVQTTRTDSGQCALVPPSHFDMVRGHSFWIKAIFPSDIEPLVGKTVVIIMDP